MWHGGRAEVRSVLRVGRVCGEFGVCLGNVAPGGLVCPQRGQCPLERGAVYGVPPDATGHGAERLLELLGVQLFPRWHVVPSVRIPVHLPGVQMVAPVVRPGGLLLRNGRSDCVEERCHILSPLGRPLGGVSLLHDLWREGVPGHVIGDVGVVHRGGVGLSGEPGVLVVVWRFLLVVGVQGVPVVLQHAGLHWELWLHGVYGRGYEWWRVAVPLWGISAVIHKHNLSYNTIQYKHSSLVS